MLKIALVLLKNCFDVKKEYKRISAPDRFKTYYSGIAPRLEQQGKLSESPSSANVQGKEYFIPFTL